MITMLWP